MSPYYCTGCTELICNGTSAPPGQEVLALPTNCVNTILGRPYTFSLPRACSCPSAIFNFLDLVSARIAFVFPGFPVPAIPAVAFNTGYPPRACSSSATVSSLRPRFKAFPLSPRRLSSPPHRHRWWPSRGSSTPRRTRRSGTPEPRRNGGRRWGPCPPACRRRRPGRRRPPGEGRSSGRASTPGASETIVRRCYSP